jgi:hypothetical protein
LFPTLKYLSKQHIGMGLLSIHGNDRRNGFFLTPKTQASTSERAAATKAGQGACKPFEPHSTIDVR